MTRATNSAKNYALRQLLQGYWGYADFRDQQAQIIEAVLAGRDTLGIMATGVGKSLCYQILPIWAEQVLQERAICVVISPLRSLIYEQVRNFNESLALRLGWRADYFGENQHNSSLWSDLVEGRVRLLYLSPERVSMHYYLERLQSLPVRYICVDEAHCVLNWGRDFRPDYLRLAGLREYFPRAIWLALSATILHSDREQICQSLALEKPVICAGDFARPNLSFSVQKTKDKLGFLTDFLRSKNNSNQGTAQQGIIYCHSRRRVLQMTEELRARGLFVEAYHAELGSAVDRKYKLDRWLYRRGNPRLDVLVSTNALGMGIDKADTRFVIHDSPPNSLMEYYQEAGRAGRDGRFAQAILLYDERDLARLQFNLENNQPSIWAITRTYQEILAYLNSNEYINEYSRETQSYNFSYEVFLQYSDLFYAEATNRNYSEPQLETLRYQTLLRHLDILERLQLFKRHLRSANSYYIKLYACDSWVLAEQTMDSELLELGMEWILRNVPVDDNPLGQRVFLGSMAKYLQTSSEQALRVLQTLATRGLLELNCYAREELCLEVLPNSEKKLLNNPQLRKMLKAILEQLQYPYSLMRAYILQETCCRSAFLAQQFSHIQNYSCGICDYCLSK